MRWLLEVLDDIWLVQEASRDKVTILNTRTQHILSIGSDHIREYLTDESVKADCFLRLKSQIFIQGRSVTLEPLDDRGEPMHSPVLARKAAEEEMDVAFRLAKGFVIEGLSPLSEFRSAGSVGINVSAFTAWITDKNTRIAYNSGSIVGLAPGITYYVFARDPERKGGSVAYMATPIRHSALAGDDKLYVGRLRTPAAAK
jgi:hypothetical protein